MPQAFGSALAKQVNLQGRVDRDQLVILAGQIRVVGEINRMDFQRRIAVHELVKLARAERESGDHLAGQIVLLAVGDSAAFDQTQNTVADHFGVDAQVMFGAQLHHHGIGNSAITDLQRRAVLDHVGNIFSDRLLHRADLGQTDLHHRITALDQRRDLRDMHMAVAIGVRHIGVDFKHHGARPGQCGHRVVGTEAE